jgi:GNAT superfamily N-acetyltransferase
VEAARPAVPDDLPRLAELHRQAKAELLPQRGGEVFLAREASEVFTETGLEAALADPCQGVWVGTIDDFVVGYVTARVETLRDGRMLGVVDPVFVEPGARAVGVGEALMDNAVPWLRAQGCFGVDAHALPGMRETKNFFETFGFTARLLVVHHRLES